MGEVKKQTINSTIFIFLGIGVGIISRILMVLIITPEQVGVLTLLDSISSMLSTIFCLGFAQITLHLFPKLKNEADGNGGYLAFTILYTVIGVILGISCYYMFEDRFLGDEIENQLLRSFGFLIVPLIFFRILFKNLDIYARIMYRTVIGVFLESVLLKILILLALVLLWMEFLGFNGMVYIYVIAFCLPGLVMFFSLAGNIKYIKSPKPILKNKSRLKNIFEYGTFGLLTTASGVIVIFIDQLMLNSFLGTAASGIYSIMFFAGTLLSIPARGIRRIASAVLSEYWHNNELKKINKFYTNSANSQLTVAIYLFILGWAFIEYALDFKPEYKIGIYVFFFIGLGQLIDLLTGINTEIIASSKYYKVNTIFNISLAVIVVLSNLYFINVFGIVGAAIASFISMTLINSARLYFLWVKFRFSPFNGKLVKILLIGTAMFLTVSLLPKFENPLLPIIGLLILITGVYWGLIFGFNLSNDLKSWVMNSILKNKKN